MFVVLSATGNPDFGQFGSIGVPRRVVEVASYREASRVCRAYIDDYDLGCGNWTGGTVYSDRARRRKVARVSYNGRVWAPDGSEITE